VLQELDPVVKLLLEPDSEPNQCDPTTPTNAPIGENLIRGFYLDETQLSPNWGLGGFFGNKKIKI
jgi:hypothetical protein